MKIQQALCSENGYKEPVKALTYKQFPVFCQLSWYIISAMYHCMSFWMKTKVNNIHYWLGFYHLPLYCACMTPKYLSMSIFFISWTMYVCFALTEQWKCSIDPPCLTLCHSLVCAHSSSYLPLAYWRWGGGRQTARKKNHAYGFLPFAPLNHVFDLWGWMKREKYIIGGKYDRCVCQNAIISSSWSGGTLISSESRLDSVLSHR